jgi:TolB-like protein
MGPKISQNIFLWKNSQIIHDNKNIIQSKSNVIIKANEENNFFSGGNKNENDLIPDLSKFKEFHVYEDNTNNKEEESVDRSANDENDHDRSERSSNLSDGAIRFVHNKVSYTRSGI